MSSNTNNQNGFGPEQVVLCTEMSIAHITGTSTSNANLKRARSESSDCHYSNGQETKKCPGVINEKEENHPGKGAEFIQSK